MQRAHANAPAVPQKELVQPHSSPKAGMTSSLQQNDSCAVDSTKKITKAITTAAQKDQKFGTIQKIEQRQIKSANDSPPPHKHQQEIENFQVDKSKNSGAKDDTGFFGFGGARSRSPSPKPAASAVTGKFLGFGTSFLSSASNMISTAVMDEPSITPSTTRKGSSVSQSSINSSTPPSSRKGSAVLQSLSSTTPPTSHKGSTIVTSPKGTGISQNITKETKKPSNEKADEKKIQEPQPSKTQSENVKDSADVKKSSQQLPKTCPLCMTDIKELLNNYSICTECKSIVCNLCGFSPMPQETEVKEVTFPFC